MGRGRGVCTSVVATEVTGGQVGPWSNYYNIIRYSVRN